MNQKISVLFLTVLSLMGCLQASQLSLYVGSPNKEGVDKGMQFVFDVEKEAWVEKLEVADGSHFRNLKLHPNGTTLYATGKQDNKAYINRYEIVSKKELVFKERMGIENAGFCHLDLHPKANALAIADIGGGKVAWCSLHPDGSFSSALKAVKVNPAPKSKLHCVKFNIEGDEIMAADIAGKCLLRLSYDVASNVIDPKPLQLIDVKASARYLYHYQPLDIWYLLNQRDGLITVVEKKDQNYEITAEHSTILPETDKNHSSDIKKVPGLPYMMAGNRVENSFAIFKMNEQTGELKKESHFMTGEDPAWYFEFSPISQHVFVCYSKTNKVRVYRYKVEDQLILEEVSQKEVPSPISVVVKTL